MSIKSKTVTVCGSMHFLQLMRSIKSDLEHLGYQVIIPDCIERHHEKLISKGTYIDTHTHKRRHNLIEDHYKNIKKSEAILVVNCKKGEKENYIGGNTFWEIGFAHILKRKIYLFNEIPKDDFYYQEILAVDPKELKGNLLNFIFEL